MKQCLKVVGIKPLIEDLRITKKEINISFKGSLKPNQLLAVKSLLNYQNGLLVAPTGSGKTVMALNLITEIKKPTVILVENITLLKQWVDRIKSFLTIKDEDGKIINPGVYYSQKKKLTGILDVISLKSLENLDVFNNYEVVIGDEIHHIASKDYEKIIRKFNSSYTYGLTATPKRSDRLEKIIFKIIGPIRYEMKNNTNEDFNKVLKVILTKYKPKENMELMNYSDIEKDLSMNLERNLIICEAVKKEYQNKKNIIILTKRIEHIDILKDLLINDCPNIYDISGQSTAKDKKAFLESIKELDEQYIIISTGKFLGEGFDLASLNTLFVAMPFKWEGTLQQYTGRLERNYNGKDEIKVYDFVDIKVRAFQNMFKVRLREYSRQNYKAIDALEDKNIIYTEANYRTKLLNDLDYAKEVILFINNYKEEKLEGFFNYDYEMIIVTDLNVRIPESVKHVKRHSLIDAIVIDRKIIYYGTINPFYYNKQDETILRIEDEEYAKELIKG